MGLRSVEGTRFGLVRFGRSDRGSRFFLRFGSAEALEGPVSGSASVASFSAAGSSGAASAAGSSEASSAAGAVVSTSAVGSSATGSSTGTSAGSWTTCSSGASVSAEAPPAPSFSSSFSFSSAISSSHLLGGAFVLDRQDAGDLAPRMAQPRARVERAGGGLEANLEELLPALAELLLELVVRQRSQVVSFQRDRPPASRTWSSPAASARRGGAPRARAARRRPT